MIFIDTEYRYYFQYRPPLIIGAALEQLDPDGSWKPLGFFSRKLSDTERRYSTYDRELLAAFAAVKHFRSILEGQPSTLLTDHKPLVHAAQQPPDKASPRQSRQLDFLFQLPITIAYTKGEDNVAADALSRVERIDMPTNVDLAALALQQSRDADLPHLLETAKIPLQPLNFNGASLHCAVDGNIIRPYIPRDMRRPLFDKLHGLAHPSVRGSVRLIAQKYFWPSMNKDIARWARACVPCQASKVHRHNRAALGEFAAPDAKFDHVHLDLVKMPLHEGLQYCLTIVDRFSRWPEAIPLPNQQAETVAKAFFEHWVCVYGTPLTISTDQGAQFEARLFTALANAIGANKIHTTPYHPQANGMVERLHRTLKAALMCSAPTPWPRALPAVLLGWRTTYKEDLQASPAEMLFGTTLRVPGDFFVHASHPDANAPTFVADLRGLMQRLRAVPGARHIPNRNPFFHGDLRTCTFVFRRVDMVKQTLEPPYTGPHRVLRRLNDQTYVIEVNGVPKTLSTSSLKPAYLDRADQLQAGPAIPAAQPPAPVPPAPASPPPAPPAPSPPEPAAFTLHSTGARPGRPYPQQATDSACLVPDATCVRHWGGHKEWMWRFQRSRQAAADGSSSFSPGLSMTRRVAAMLGRGPPRRGEREACSSAHTWLGRRTAKS